eukprot:13670675-Alexandrium_andersonii.AAC.1
MCIRDRRGPRGSCKVRGCARDHARKPGRRRRTGERVLFLQQGMRFAHGCEFAFTGYDDDLERFQNDVEEHL